MGTYAKQRRSPKLRQIGTWATWWWGVTCSYFLLLALLALELYRAGSVATQAHFVAAMQRAFAESLLLQILLAVIILGWVIGTVIWFGELKRQKISYKVALKDLFFTILK